VCFINAMAPCRLERPGLSRRRVALGIGANMLERMAGIALQLALVPVLASHWGLELYGVWAMLTALPGILLLGDLGFATAASVRMTMQIARGDRDSARITMHSASQVVLIAGAMILAVAAAVAAFMPDAALSALSAATAADLRTALVCLALYAVLIIANGLVLAVFRSNERFALGSLLSTLTLLLENILLVTVVALGHGIAIGAMAMLAGRASGTAIGLLTSARLRTGVMPGLRHGNRAARSELIGPAVAAMAIPLGLALMLQGQVVALGAAAGAATVPAFVAARTLSRLGLQLSQALAHPLIPEFGVASARGNKRGVLRMFALVLVAALFIAVTFAIILAVAGPWIVMTWSAGHIAVPRETMWAIAVSALCGGIWNPVSNLMLAINRQASFAPVLVALAAIGVLVTLSVGSWLGSTAAALAMAAVDLMMLIVVLRFGLTNWASIWDLRRTINALVDEARSEAMRLMRRR